MTRGPTTPMVSKTAMVVQSWHGVDIFVARLMHEYKRGQTSTRFFAQPEVHLSLNAGTWSVNPVVRVDTISCQRVTYKGNHGMARTFWVCVLYTHTKQNSFCPVRRFLWFFALTNLYKELRTNEERTLQGAVAPGCGCTWQLCHCGFG